MKTPFLKLTLAAAISLASQGIFAAESKIALVIGIGEYDSPLRRNFCVFVFGLGVINKCNLNGTKIKHSKTWCVF